MMNSAFFVKHWHPETKWMLAFLQFFNDFYSLPGWETSKVGRILESALLSRVKSLDPDSHKLVSLLIAERTTITHLPIGTIHLILTCQHFSERCLCFLKHFLILSVLLNWKTNQVTSSVFLLLCSVCSWTNENINKRVKCWQSVKRDIYV